MANINRIMESKGGTVVDSTKKFSEGVINTTTYELHLGEDIYSKKYDSVYNNLDEAIAMCDALVGYNVFDMKSKKLVHRGAKQMSYAPPMVGGVIELSSTPYYANQLSKTPIGNISGKYYYIAIFDKYKRASISDKRNGQKIGFINI